MNGRQEPRLPGDPRWSLLTPLFVICHFEWRLLAGALEISLSESDPVRRRLQSALWAFSFGVFS